jgi:GNAT superfamily N-acetyltransferase
MILEEFTQELLDSPTLVQIIGKLPLQSIKDQEKCGALYRSIIVDNEAIGMVFISDVKDCSVLVHPKYQKKGFGMSALQQLITVAFEECNYNKLTAKTQIGRPGSRLISKLGFKEVSRTNDEAFHEYTIEMWINNKA